MTLQVNQVIRSLAEAIPSNSVKIAQVAKSRHLQIIHLPFVCGEMCLKAVSVTDDFHQSRLSSFRLMFQTQAKFVCVCGFAQLPKLLVLVQRLNELCTPFFVFWWVRLNLKEQNRINMF